MRKEATEGRLKTSLRLMVLAAALSLLFTLYIPPLGADPIARKKEEARQVERQLASLQADLNRLTAELNQTQSRLAVIRSSIETNRVQLQEAEAEYQRRQGILSDRIVAIYKHGSATAMEVLLECEDLDSFLNSYDYMARIGDHDAGILRSTRNLMAEIGAKRAELENARAQQEAYSSKLQSQSGAIENKLDEQKRILAGIDAEVASMLSSRHAGATNGGSPGGGSPSSGGTGGSPSRGGTGGSPSGWSYGPVNGMYFPVAGPHSFTNDWHAPRSVGRLHKGNDIFAPRGTPCVAITSGRVVQRSGVTAGLFVFLYGDDGHTYWYMHLDAYGKSGRVNAGDVIGYVGDTGNARGTPPHLHFEFHPNNGPAVNPYPLLMALRP